MLTQNSKRYSQYLHTKHYTVNLIVEFNLNWNKLTRAQTHMAQRSIVTSLFTAGYLCVFLYSIHTMTDLVKFKKHQLPEVGMNTVSE